MFQVTYVAEKVPPTELGIVIYGIVFLIICLADLRSIYWLQRNYPAPVQSSPEPPEDSISTLVSMGFDRNSVRQALVQARNDVNLATNILLEAQSH